MKPIIAKDRLWIDKLVYLTVGMYVLFFSRISYFLYDNLLYKDFDLAVHAQTMWNLAHGSGFSSVLGVHFLANHFIPIFYLLKYAYFLFQTPLFLLFLQSLSLGFGGLLVYEIAREYLDRPWSFLVVLSYLFYPPLGYANIFEFHPTTLAVPLLFLVILAYLRNQLVLFSLWSVLAMSCQENIALSIFMFGLLALADRKRPRWVILPMVMAALWLTISIGWLQPMLNQGTIEFSMIYSHLGKNLGEVATKILTQPWVLLPALFSTGTFTYLLGLFGSLLFLPLLGWRFCIPILPFFLQHVLSAREAEHTIFYHYAAEMTPFLITGTVLGIARFLKRFEEKIIHYLLVFSLFACFMITSILISPFFESLNRLEQFRKSQTLKYERSLLKEIPADASVVSTFRYLPSLSQRREAYSFHHVYMGYYTLSHKHYILPASVDYALIDLQDASTFGFESPDSPKNLKSFFKENPWEVIKFAGDTLLLKKGKTDFSALYELNPTDAGLPKNLLEVSANQEIELTGFDLKMGSADHEGHVGLTFYWKCLKETKSHYGLGITLVSPRGETVYEYFRHFVYRLYPTHEWRTGDVIVENYWLIMPPKLPRESLELRIGVFDLDKQKLETFDGKLKEKIDKHGRVRLETFDPY